MMKDIYGIIINAWIDDINACSMTKFVCSNFSFEVEATCTKYVMVYGLSNICAIKGNSSSSSSGIIF